MTTGIEIERKYLLRALPVIPAEWSRVDIEQGYLDAAHVSAVDDPTGVEHIREGRLRRTVRADGSVTCTHTIKRGMGLVREETEKEISEAQFAALWPRTEGMRLRKTRWSWRDGDLDWVIDEFHGLNLVLAEVEMPSVDTEVFLPEFLAVVTARDVTAELEFVNSEIARRFGLER